MESDDKPRSIRFPQWLWDEIDRDAIACRRSAVKQMEVVLTTYYRGDSPEVNRTKLQGMKGHQAEAGTLKLNTPAEKRKTG